MTTKKRTQIFLTSIILIAILGAGMWFIFNILKEKDLNIIPSDEVIANNQLTEANILNFIETYNLEEFEKMETTFDKLENQFKLIIAFNFLVQNDANDFKSGVSAVLFESHLKHIFGRGYTIEHENIISKNVTYNEEANIYIAEESTPDSRPITIMNRKSESHENRGEYIITYTKAYSWDNETVYGNLSDAMRRTNQIFKGQVDTKFEENHYSDLKTKIKRIRYAFMKENNNIVLKNVEILD